MANENAGDAGGKEGLAALAESPKGDGAGPAGGTSSTGAGAPGSGTSSSPIDITKLTRDEAIEHAAKVERAATLRRHEADRMVREAEDTKTTSAKAKEEADQKLASAAKLMLAKESLTKGQKVAALKAFMEDAWNPAELMELISLEFPAGEGETKTEKPVVDTVKELIEAHDKKKADAEAEAKKKDDDERTAAADKKKDEDRSNLVKEWKVEGVKHIKAEDHPELKAKLDAWIEDFGEEKAKEMMGQRLMETFYRVLREHNGKALDPDEAATVAEVEFTNKKKPTKTAEAELDDELSAIDASERKAAKEAGEVMRRSETAPPKKKRREEMTAVEEIEAELAALDAKEGASSLY